MSAKQTTQTEPLLLRYSDLVRLGVVRNRMTLSRWMHSNAFPRPIELGANSVAWRASDVEAWLAGRQQRTNGNGTQAATEQSPEVKKFVVSERNMLAQIRRGKWIGSIFADGDRLMRVRHIGKVFRDGAERCIEVTAELVTDGLHSIDWMIENIGAETR